MRNRTLLSLAALAALAGGCADNGGSSAENDRQAQTTVTVEKIVKVERAKKKRTKPAATETSSATVSDTSGGRSITVPAVVGHDHQLAQDEMQAAGLYLLQEEDCTGQDRVLIWDRNWTVVDQDPPAGSQVNEDAAITLCSKKDWE
jgi:hypothetical protein